MADGDGHIKIKVRGEPRPQGSKAPFSGAVESETGTKIGSHKAWRQLVALEAQQWATANTLTSPVEGPVEVTLWFWKIRPKSYPRWRWLWCTEPDADKLTRSVLDSLSGVIYTDDARVSDLHVHKRLSINGTEGVVIMVRPLAHIESDLGHWWGDQPDADYPDLADPPRGDR